MLQQAGGLPVGYTELEYLESSGTQFIRTGILPDNGTGGRVKWAMSTLKRYSQVLGSTNADAMNNALGPGLFFAPHFNSPENGFLAAFMDRTTGFFYTPATPSPGEIFISDLNYRESRTASFNGVLMGTFPALPSNFCPELTLFGANSTTNSPAGSNVLIGRIYAATLTQGANISAEFIPAVRNSDGAAGMFERISQRFIENAGTGSFGYRIKTFGETIAPFARRDPYYTPPSGVYARLIAENTLDILADTDIAADAAEQAGYTWHPNTGDAYTAYDITPEPEITA